MNNNNMYIFFNFNLLYCQSLFIDSKKVSEIHFKSKYDLTDVIKDSPVVRYY